MTTPDLQKKVGIYTRTAAPQERRQLTVTDDLVRFAKEQGWTEDHIVLFNQDEGKSGKKSINERKGLRALVEAITHDEIKTVITANEDRLFRNADTIEVSTFVRLCQEYNVILITPTATYDFSDNVQAKLFRLKCEDAYENVKLIKGAIYARVANRKQTNTSGE